MKFRPCIDIHNGKVKQIVGGSLTDTGDWAQTNFVAERPAQWFASRYRDDGLTGGHVILLNSPASRYFERQGIRPWKRFPRFREVCRLVAGSVRRTRKII